MPGETDQTKPQPAAHCTSDARLHHVCHVRLNRLPSMCTAHGRHYKRDSVTACRRVQGGLVIVEAVYGCPGVLPQICARLAAEGGEGRSAPQPAADGMGQELGAVDLCGRCLQSRVLSGLPLPPLKTAISVPPELFLTYQQRPSLSLCGPHAGYRTDQLCSQQGQVRCSATTVLCHCCEGHQRGLLA